MNNQRQEKAAKYLSKIAGRFLGDKRGVAALEFALIAPVLILLYLGTVEMTDGVDVNKNLGRATSMVADLVTQQTTVTVSDLSNIMKIGQATLLPYRRDTPQITIVSINISAAGNPTVIWSRRLVNGSETRPYNAGSAITLDANLRIPSTTVVQVEMKLAYAPRVPWTITGKTNTAAGASIIGIPMSKTSYGRIRQGSNAVTCSNCP